MDMSDVDKGASELRDEQKGCEGNTELSHALHLCWGRDLGRGDRHRNCLGVSSLT